MQAHIKLGKIFGIQIGLHFSWLLIALLVTLSLAGHFSAMNPEWGGGVIWTTAVVTGLLFFVAIILHELAHAVVAKMRGLPVRSITLFALGGVALIGKESGDAATEFWMGIAGPIASVLIGLLCLLTAGFLGWSPETQMLAPQTPVLAAIVWLGYINIVLAIFNLIPGFPMDGGRILRAIVWWITGNVDRATRTAARVGQFVGVLFIVWGIFQFFSGLGFSGLWIAFIGWFLLNAAGASHARVEVMRTLQGLKAGDVMRSECQTVDVSTNLQRFIDNDLFRIGGRCFFVTEGDRIVGLLTPHEIKEVPRDSWADITVGEVMRPYDQLHTVGPQTPLSEALETMTRDDVNQLPVMSGSRVEGVVSRANILQLLRTRSELEV